MVREQALVFLHGFMGTADDWAPVVRGLSGRYHCLSVDLPGHGCSPGLPRYSFPAVARCVAKQIRQDGVSRPILVGYSLGGRLALHMALTRPRAFGALVLLSASPGLEEPRARRERRRRDDELSRQMMSRDVRQFLRGWYAQDVFKGLPPDTAAQLVRRRARVNVAEASKVLRHLSPGRTPSNWRRLEALEMPLSIVSGACDTGYVETGKRMARLCPRAVHAIVPRSSHAVLIEQPRRVAGLIRRFAEEVFHEETQVGKRRRLHGCPVP